MTDRTVFMSVVVIVENRKIPDDLESSTEASNVSISSGGRIGGEIAANGGREKNGSTSNELVSSK
jgi:hypothetical protein